MSLPEAPYDPYLGELVRHVEPGQAAEWRTNRPFAGTMGHMSMVRGHSSVYFVWQGEDGRRWPMHAADLTALIQSGTAIAGGSCTAVWEVSKRRLEYGIRLAPGGVQ